MPISPKIGRVRFEEASKDLLTDYTINGKRSHKNLKNTIIKGALEPWFRGRRMAGGQDADARGSVEDFARARRELEADIPDDRERLALMKRGDNYARHIVVTNWPLISALATRLQKDRRLTGAQVLAFVREYNEKEARHAAGA